MLAPVVTPILGAQFGWSWAIAAACLICGLGGLLWLGIDADRHSNGPHQGPGVGGY